MVKTNAVKQPKAVKQPRAVKPRGKKVKIGFIIILKSVKYCTKYERSIFDLIDQL